MKLPEPDPLVSRRLGRWPIARLAGLSGLLMVAAIVVNGPLAAVAERYPSFWTASARVDLRAFLRDSHRLDRAVIFFALSNLIFVFAIPFFAGLRVVMRNADPSGLLRSVVAVAVPLFLAGGLVSEVFSHGMPIVIESVPGYDFDLNSALMVQGLQYVALVQGQVALGVALIALSFAGWSSGVLPMWIWWLGAAAGILDLVRPFAVTSPPILVAAFVPTFVWIAAISIALIRRSPLSTETPEAAPAH
jgi:hypothetical protein